MPDLRISSAQLSNVRSALSNRTPIVRARYLELAEESISAAATTVLGPTVPVSLLTLSADETLTLATAAAGTLKYITAVGGTYACTLSGSTIDGYSTALFDATGETLMLVSNGSGWSVVVAQGATLA